MEIFELLNDVFLSGGCRGGVLDERSLFDNLPFVVGDCEGVEVCEHQSAFAANHCKIGKAGSTRRVGHGPIANNSALK